MSSAPGEQNRLFLKSVWLWVMTLAHFDIVSVKESKKILKNRGVPEVV